METRLNIAVQKSGRLLEDSLRILKECGIRVDNGKDQLKASARNFPANLLYLRNSDIPKYVEDGVADIGIIGQNTVFEKQKEMTEVLPLGFSRCRLSIAIPKGTDYPGPEFLNGKKIATSYPNSLRHFLAENNLKAEIHEISGSVEIAPNIGLADAICDLVSTGSTLFKNGLEEKEVILRSEASIYASPVIKPEAKAILDQIVFRIKSVLEARRNKYLLMNAPNEKIDQIIQILPGMKSPTVMPLAASGWSSIHTVINEDRFWEIIDALKANGAQGILIVPIEKMIIQTAMKVYNNPERSTWPDLLKRPTLNTQNLDALVSGILDEIRLEGNAAIRRYTEKFDGVALDNFQVSVDEIWEAGDLLSDELKTAIQLAKANIEKFHMRQKVAPEVIETMPGVQCWRKSVPIERVGLYIPGGTAPLFSTVLMLGVPAKLAGCKEIVLCSPPDKNGKLHPAIIYTANLIGIDKIFKIGGVQAIGGMAYGTETIPNVYKIMGPGNQYVTAAKQVVSQEGIAIDMPAGPSEVLVCADETANPAFVAADLLSQAEHGIDSQVVLVVFEEAMANAVQVAINEQLEKLPRREIAAEALKNSVSIVGKDRESALDLINEYAPEHLILAIKNAEELAERVINAGSVFLGNYTPESVGDYASGTNHTLPTNGYARAYSGVSLDTFVKKITFQRLTEEGLQNVGPAVEAMAAAEELMAHKQAVSIRLKKIK